MTKKAQRKQQFFTHLQNFVASLNSYVSTDDGQWTIKGFIDIYKNIYTISSDTKIVSKILEIHLFPHVLQFAEQHGYYIVLPEHQNYYPDLSFIDTRDPSIKFAVDLKTTYRLPESSEFCNGFTLGSHGEYFIQRNSRKNIQFPYSDYLGHYCLGIIYSRATLTILMTRLPIRLIIFVQLSLSFEIFSSLRLRNGELPVIRAEAEIPPILGASIIFLIFSRATGCLRSLEKRGLMTIG